MNSPFYWDLTERERAALTREDVERFIDAELMTKGVLKAREPVLETVPDVAAKMAPRFRIKGDPSDWHGPKLLFATEEQALAFLKLEPEFETSFYNDGVSISHGKRFDKSIDSVQILPAAEYDAHKSSLQAAATIRAANKKACEEYDAALKKQNQTLEGLWNDWSTQRQRDHKLRGVMATYEEYRRIAASQDIALRFLRKVHSVNQIEEAAEWCGVALPADWEFAEVDAGPMPVPDLTSDETAAMAF